MNDQNGATLQIIKILKSCHGKFTANFPKFLSFHSVHSYGKSSIKPLVGGLVNFGPSRRGVNREGAYSKHQVTRIYLVTSVLLSCTLQNQHAMLRLTYINIDKFLSQTIQLTIPTLTCKVVQQNKWKIFGKF